MTSPQFYITDTAYIAECISNDSYSSVKDHYVLVYRHPFFMTLSAGSLLKLQKYSVWIKGWKSVRDGKFSACVSLLSKLCF